MLQPQEVARRASHQFGLPISGWLVVHLSKESLYIFATAAASQEIDVEPWFALEMHSVFFQRLHSIKLSTRVTSIVVMESIMDDAHATGFTGVSNSDRGPYRLWWRKRCDGLALGRTAQRRKPCLLISGQLRQQVEHRRRGRSRICARRPSRTHLLSLSVSLDLPYLGEAAGEYLDLTHGL